MDRIQDIQITEYDYPLPPERIALHPSVERDGCLLLVSRAPFREIEVAQFSSLADHLPEGSLLVGNDTRVINARLHFRKADGGARIEIFCLEPEHPADYAVNFASTEPVLWRCLVGNSKRWKSGELELRLESGTTVRAERTARRDDLSLVRFSWDDPEKTFSDIIAEAGEIPIPPYLNRDTEDADSEDYQTVYSRWEGSVAAPTAGLHFTPRVLDSIAARGIDMLKVTLHVGAGTFRPVKSDTIGGHDMHSEFIAVRRNVIERLIQDRERPVIAVGTTSVRTLETLYQLGSYVIQHGRLLDELPQWYAYDPSHPQTSRTDALRALLDAMGDSPVLIANTRLMIAPGYRFGIVSGMVTNFHQPRSTLLLLVDAFLGNGRWRNIYDYALRDKDFRFLSYGDACLFLKPDTATI